MSDRHRLRYTSALVLVCMTTSLALSATAPRVHDGESAATKAWHAAMEAGDLAALERMHGPNTVGFSPNRMRLVGGHAIIKDYAALLATYTIRVSVDDAHWIENGPLLFSWGLTTLRLRPKTGGPDVVTHTRFTDVATRIDGGWLYLVDHASMPTK